ncbi:MAG: sigma-70 family RNA polymerase sigma factor [Planctomycetales bacterium]|nr:sigma-70 family RNA polymerase sigma factor [Planctomycetales bacterium]
MNGVDEPDDDSDGRLLLGRLAAGDAEAFAELYDRFGLRLHRTAARWLRSRDDADDVVQELFLSIVRSQSHLRRVENLPAYLFASLRRFVTRTIQKRQRSPRVVAVETSDVAAKIDDARQLNQRECVEAALQSLSAEQQEVIVMKTDGELTFAEIAAVLGISPNTAASRYRYALEKLRCLVSDR